MIWRLVAIVAILGIVGGCARISASPLNPFNWFGRDRQVTEVVVRPAVETDPRPLVDQVLAVRVERAAGGAILHATGLPPRQGYHDAGLLVEVDAGPGVLSYQFRLAPPLTPTRVSTQASREVEVATFLSDQTLAGVREIRVLGARSSRAVRR